MIIRYFGGTKLDTGGLVKAYTEAAQKAIESLPVEELVTRISFKIDLTYDMYDQVIKVLKLNSAEIIEPVFDTQIHISGSIPEKDLSAADEAIQDVSAGRVKIFVEK